MPRRYEMQKFSGPGHRDKEILRGIGSRTDPSIPQTYEGKGVYTTYMVYIKG